MEDFKQVPLPTNQEFNSIRVVLLLLVITGCFVFIGYNLYNRNFSLLGSVYYPWGENSQATDSFTVAITSASNQPVARDLLGINVEAMFDNIDTTVPNFNTFLDAAGFTNYRFPGAEANLFHYNALVPPEYQSCSEINDSNGNPIFDMRDNSLQDPLAPFNWGHGHWPCQVFLYNNGNAYEEDLSQGTYTLQKTHGRNYVDDFASVANRVGASQMYTINPSTSSVTEVIDTITHLKSLGVPVKYVELGEEHYLQNGNDWYCNFIAPCNYDVNDYVARVAPYASAIKSFDSSIIIAANAAPYWKASLSNNNNSKTWNNGLASAVNAGSINIDAVTTHYYPPTKNSAGTDCSTLGNIDSIMSCAVEATVKNSKSLVSGTGDYYLGLFPGKKILFTEYNTSGNEGNFANTMIQGLFVGSFLNSVNEYNSQHANAIVVANIHSLSDFLYSPIDKRGGSEAIIDSVGEWDEQNSQVINTNSGGDHSGDAIRRINYWPLQFTSLVFQNGKHIVNTSITTSNDSNIIIDQSNPYFRVNTYIGNDTKYYIYITNFSGVPLKMGSSSSFSINGSQVNLATPITYNYFSAPHLYDGRGKSGLQQTGVISIEENANVYKDVDTTLSSLLIPGFSFGYFVLDTNDIPLEVNNPPSITLLGNNNITLNQNDIWVDPGAKANDSEDGDISNNIIITGTVNTQTPGLYTLTYTITDSGSLSASVTRNVTVTADSSTSTNGTSGTTTSSTTGTSTTGSTTTSSSTSGTTDTTSSSTGSITTSSTTTDGTGGTISTTSTSGGGDGVSTTTTSTTDGGTTTSGTTSGGTGEVPPPPQQNGGLCTPYLTTYIQYGYDNNSDDVTRLQTFLNSHEGETLTITGTYDSPTFEAVKRFQSKYASSVLTVWGLSSPTGYVYKTTRNKINSFNCNTTIICPEFSGDFVPGETDPEISKIKSLLNDLGFAAGSGEYYDDTMKSAVVDFQETFHKVILDPWGLSKGTAWIHNTTRKYLNDLVGCATGPADLDGKGSFEY